MSDLEILRTSFVAFVDGMWWGLRDNTGPLSMYEGYERGFQQIGQEHAEKVGGSGPQAAASMAAEIMTAMGLDVEAKGSEIIVKECPIWNRIAEKGLEFAFHIEKICWIPMLEGIGEKTGTKPVMVNALRLNTIAKTKLDYKAGKAKAALEKGAISQEEFDKENTILSIEATKIAEVGQYKFE
jgi:hypothetical protein